MWCFWHAAIWSGVWGGVYVPQHATSWKCEIGNYPSKPRVMNRGGNKDHSISWATLLMWVMNLIEMNNIFKPFVVWRPTWGDLCPWGVFPSVIWRDVHTAVWVAVIPSLTSPFTPWFLYFCCSCQTFTFNIYTDLLTGAHFLFQLTVKTVYWISLCCGHKTFKEVILGFGKHRSSFYIF